MEVICDIIGFLHKKENLDMVNMYIGSEKNIWYNEYVCEEAYLPILNSEENYENEGY